MNRSKSFKNILIFFLILSKLKCVKYTVNLPLIIKLKTIYVFIRTISWNIHVDHNLKITVEILNMLFLQGQ